MPVMAVGQTFAHFTFAHFLRDWLSVTCFTLEIPYPVMLCVYKVWLREYKQRCCWRQLQRFMEVCSVLHSALLCHKLNLHYSVNKLLKS